MEKPLRVKQGSSKQTLAYYDDTLTGPPPTFKKPLSLPALNTTTTFPPPIPRPGNDSSRPGSQQEMQRAGASGIQSTKEKEELGFYDGICLAFGRPSRDAKAKIQKSQEQTNKNTVRQLSESLKQILSKKNHQLHEAQRAATNMLSAETQLAAFLASPNANKEHPLFLNYVTTWNHHSQQLKIATREKAILEKREEEVNAYLENYTAEEHQNQIHNIILEHYHSAKALGVDGKQMQTMKQVNMITQKQSMLREHANFLAPNLSPLDEVLEVSDDVQRMVARCDAMVSTLRRPQNPPPPGGGSPPPTAYTDANLLLPDPDAAEQETTTLDEKDSDDNIL